MESVLLKANLVNLSTGQYWLNFDGEKGMSDREGHGHWAVVYKSHPPPLRHSFRQRHHCIHRLINHVYTKANTHSLLLPHDRRHIIADAINQTSWIQSDYRVHRHEVEFLVLMKHYEIIEHSAIVKNSLLKTTELFTISLFTHLTSNLSVPYQEIQKLFLTQSS